LRDEVLVQVLQSVVTSEEEKQERVNNPGVPKKAELSPDITMPPPLPRVVPVADQKADLCERAKKLFPPSDPLSELSSGRVGDREEHLLSYRVYLTGMDIMAKMRTDSLEYLTEEPTESEDGYPTTDEGPFHNSVLTRKIVRRLYRRGLPAERLLEVFQGHSSSEQRDISNWLNGKCYAKLMSFMERVYTVIFF